MFERRDLIDAIKVKEVRTGSDIDEKAGAEVHRRLVAPSLYARRLTPKGKQWYTKPDLQLEKADPLRYSTE